MDKEQTENAAEDDYTGARESVEVQVNIAHHAGKDADGGGDHIR